MSINFKNSVFGLVAVLPLVVSCGPSLSEDGTGSVGSGSTGSTFSRQTDYSINLNIDFAGIADASAISPSEVLISWGDAMFIDDPASAAGMRYVIFRGLTHQAPLRDIGQIAITGQGQLTFTDDFSDLENPPPLDNTTWYYSVVAIADERISNNVQVAIARTPSAYAPGTMSFETDGKKSDMKLSMTVKDEFTNEDLQISLALSDMTTAHDVVIEEPTDAKNFEEVIAQMMGGMM